MESMQDRLNRLERNIATTRLARDVESQEERESRLQRNRLVTREAQNVETQETRNDRLQRNRLATREARNVETQEQCVHRLQEDRARHAQRRRVRADMNNFHWENAAFEYDANISYECPIGEMSFVCEHCGARKWRLEAPGMCYSNGKIRLPIIGIPPEPLQSLLLEDNPRTKAFQKNIRKYNSAFQMTSYGTTMKHNQAAGEWARTSAPCNRSAPIARCTKAVFPSDLFHG